MATPTSARKTVLVLMSFSAGITFAGRLIDGKDFRPRLLIGALFVAIVLTMMSDGAPGISSGLAVIIFMTVLATSGPQVLGKLQRTL